MFWLEGGLLRLDCTVAQAFPTQPYLQAVINPDVL